jgi:glycerol-3-phosphate O-acyltransferase/dihydroxyacetone phosphate acyltransferase
MAEVSFKRAFVGAMARGIGAVPVSRAQDIAVKAEGTIFLPDPINSPKLVRGVGTDFMGEGFKAGGSIYLPSMNGESQKLDIAQILGPEDVILRSEVKNEDALFLLTAKRKPVNGMCMFDPPAYLVYFKRVESLSKGFWCTRERSQAVHQ